MNTEQNNSIPSFSIKKDIPLIILSILLVISIFLTSYFLKPNSSDNTYVEIKYQSQLLFDKNDSNKSTRISFPKEGEKKLTFTKEESNIYLSNDTFAFQGDSITITLYSDKSVQILYDEVYCKDHTCSKMGRIYQTYVPLVCLPNHIEVMIKNESFPEFDA